MLWKVNGGLRLIPFRGTMLESNAKIQCVKSFVQISSLIKKKLGN